LSTRVMPAGLKSSTAFFWGAQVCHSVAKPW
jgi:hypothetical protein